MDNFLDKYHLPKFNHDQISKLNRPITAEEIQRVIKSLQTIKSPRDGFSLEFYKIFKEQLISTLLKLLRTKETEETLTKSFYEATIILTPKPHKDSTKRGNYRPISLMNNSELQLQ